MSRILLVDSDLSLCTRVSRTFNGLGYLTDVAYDTDEARRLSRLNDYRVGVFGEQLVDGDGATLFTELRGTQRGMCGVLLTNAGNLNTVVKAVGAGFSHVLPCPVESAQLVDTITAMGPLERTSGAAAPVLDDPSTDMSEESIAELTPTDISERLSDSDLIGVIRSVEYPFAGKDRLEHFDRDTLERVVHLIRRWCRNRAQLVAW